MRTKIVPAAEEPASTAVQVVEAAPIAHYSADTYDDVSRDVEVPVLALINNVGPLAKQFTNKAGNFVLGDTLVGESVKVIPVQVSKYYRETVRNGVTIKYGSPEDKARRIFASAQDAAKAGYAVDFDNVHPNRIEECGKIGYLVIKPAGDKSGEFVLKAGPLELASARCSYQRGGYREVWRRVFEHAHKLALGKGVATKGLNHGQVFSAAQAWTHAWTISAAQVDGAQNSWWEPRIAKSDPLPADTVAWITANYGSL